MSVENNLKSILQKIELAEKRANRKSGSVQLLAVSKTFSSERVRELHQLGVSRFAENYVQEAIPKQEELKDCKIEWHFIGHLQSNKVKSIADRFSLIHSVDSVKLATEISKRTKKEFQNVLIEVNLAGETTKSGVLIQDLPPLLDGIQKLERVQIRGFMFMPPLNLNYDAQRSFFEQAQETLLKQSKNLSTPHSLVELSMGTSHDYELAIEAGATIVRLGTALFGERDYGRN